jgi:hypothetical protein
MARSRNSGKPMDEGVEAFLADVLVLEGEDVNAIRQGVRGCVSRLPTTPNCSERRKSINE